MSAERSVIAGAGVGGVLPPHQARSSWYGLDTVSFVASFCLVHGPPKLLAGHPRADAGRPGRPRGKQSILEGLAYARGRPDLLGSYLADLAAMTLSYPNALFPFMAADLHADWVVVG